MQRARTSVRACTVVVAATLLGCAADGGVGEPGTDAGPGFDASTAPRDGGAAPGDATVPPSDGGGSIPPDAGATDAPLEVELLSRELVCKLISGDSMDAESANRTHTRFNLRGTDLGTPAIVGDELHLFFGDTHGWREIWRVGEDPDSVARVSLADARADITTLCRSLDFYVTGDIPSVAADTDPSVQRDFEGGYLRAPPGELIRDYIDRPVAAFATETGSFAGSFEVPSGAISHAGETYVFWSTRPGTGAIGPMRLSFIARWDSAGSSPLLYQILHSIDDLEWDRPLGGHFLQNAPVITGEHLYLFGTGRYREDGVHLARKPASDIDAPGGFELYDPRTEAWVVASSISADERAAIPAIIDESVRGIGELGVQYVESAGLYVLMYQQLSAASSGNQMVMQVARAPTGPWSRLSVIRMEDPDFRLRHCCIPGGDCPGERILHCDMAGLYAIYPLPLIEAADVDGAIELTVPFVASTWVPYSVVLFRATVRIN